MSLPKLQHHRGPCGHREGVPERHGRPADHVAARRVALDALLEAIEGEGARLLCVVEDDHHRVVGVVAEVDVGIVLRDVVGEAAVVNHVGVLAPRRQGGHEVMRPVLAGRAALLGEHAPRVAGPAAGHVGPLRAVALHVQHRLHQLGGVVDLRDAARRHEERVRQLEGVLVLVHDGEKPGEVVVVEEGDKLVGRGVDVVLGERPVEVVDAPAVGGEGVLHRKAEREVGDARQVRVVVVGVGLEVVLPVGLVGHGGHPALAHDVEVGVLLQHGRRPARHVVLVGVEVRVHPDAVDAGRLDPPERVLNQVGGEQLVVLVEIGHGGDEPGVRQLLAVVLGGIRVDDGGTLVVGGAVFVEVVDPVAGRRVVHPPVPVADVVVDHVHDHLQVPLVGAFYEPAERVVAPEARVHPIHVGGRVAVVGAIFRGHVVLEDGRDPEGRHAQVVDVVEVLADAGEVPAVARVGVGAVDPLQKAGDRVVFGGAVCEPVRHEEVDHVLTGEALGVRAGAAGPELKVAGERSLVVAEAEGDRAGRGRVADAEANEKVVGVLDLRHPVQRHAGASPNLHSRRGEVLAVDHQLDGRPLHVDPPEGRVDAVDLGRLCQNEGGAGEQEQDGGEEASHGGDLSCGKSTGGHHSFDVTTTAHNVGPCPSGVHRPPTN